jgi:hypothetical protein
MAKLLVWAIGLFFILYGIAFIIAPTEMAVFVTGDSPKTPSGVIDLRATYGGMSISVGTILLIVISKVEHLRLALLLTAIVLLAMAAGRSVGMFQDGEPNVVMYLYLVAELIFSLTAFWLRAKVKNSHHSSTQVK